MIAVKLPEDLSPAIARDLRRYIKAHYSAQQKPERNGGVPTYWRALPAWLVRKSLRNHVSNAAANRFLRDVILGQRLLYLAIRIQDDLFDGQVRLNSLLFGSDQLLLEAEDVFSRQLPGDSKFWKVYRDCLRTTTQSIVDVDRLQKSLRTKPERLLNMYGKVCSIFRIGSAAVCARSKQWQHFTRVSLFCDEMAKAGQIIDDLTDVQEDLERKRYNYAANILYLSGNAIGKRGSPHRGISHGYVYGEGLERIFREVYRHVEGARRAIKPLMIPEADHHVTEYGALVSKIKDEFIRSRVKTFFSTLIKPDGKRS